jgi:serine/threonine protein kinase
VDVFSIGVVLYALVSGVMPFAARTIAETVKKNANCNLFFSQKRFGNVNQEIVRFLTQLMSPNPVVRLTAEEALQNSWILSCLDRTPRVASSSNLSTSYIMSFSAKLKNFESSGYNDGDETGDCDIA